MQKLILPFCSKCTILFLLALPFGLSAQSTNQAQTAQEQAEALFIQQNPQVQKVDLEKLQSEQKDQHKKCNTCGKKATQTGATTSTTTNFDLQQLKAEENRLKAILQGMVDDGNTDKALYDKYKRALILNQQKVKVAENQKAVADKKELAPKK